MSNPEKSTNHFEEKCVLCMGEEKNTGTMKLRDEKVKNCFETKSFTITNRYILSRQNLFY